MSAAAELDALYAQAARVTAAGSHSFHFATRFFPRDMARGAHAVYWFCRYTDDLVDECATPERGRRDLEDWAALLHRALAGAQPDHPVLAAFLDAVNRFQIPHEHPLELIEGMRMDLAGTRYDHFADLRVFCYRVASTVGLMMAHVIGFRPGALDYAVDLGIALQLTNILRDVGDDLARGRLYLPADEMRRFGCTESSLRHHVLDEAFRRMMRFQVARARHYYALAEPGIALLAPGGRFAVRIAADVYREILTRIEQSGYQVFTRRATVPAVRKCGIAVRHYAARIAAWRPA